MRESGFGTATAGTRSWRGWRPVTGCARRGPGTEGLWRNTMTTAADLVRYYGMPLDGKGGLSPDLAAIIINDLARSTAQGDDG